MSTVCPEPRLVSSLNWITAPAWTRMFPAPVFAVGFITNVWYAAVSKVPKKSEFECSQVPPGWEAELSALRYSG